MHSNKINTGFFIALIGATLMCLVTGDCPFPASLPNGEFVYQDYMDFNLTVAPENYLLQFECDIGFIRTAPKAIICVNGAWSDRVPRCIKKRCQFPPSILNGKYRLSKKESEYPSIGTTARYTCKVGFELDNDTNSIITCHLDIENNYASWKGEVPSCVERKICDDPGVSKNGKKIGGCCFQGDNITYVCDDGYELIGASNLYCDRGGIWSSARPLCRPLSGYCEPPPSIPNGIVKGKKSGDYYRPYDEVEIICDGKSAFKGESEYIMCEKNSEWEMEFGECVEKLCDLPEPLANGTILNLESSNQTEFAYNFPLNYVCDKGYVLKGPSLRHCVSGEWTGEDPKCELIKCPDPGVPEFGFKKGSNYNIGEKVVFSCFTGFVAIGSRERYCMPNGQWSGELARCDTESNYCPNPGIPINGMKNSSSYEMGEVIGFHCHAGYSQVGSEARECLPNKTWTGTETRCLGRYDFDNTREVSEILTEDFNQKAAEQNAELDKYRIALSGVDSDGNISIQSKRAFNINYSGRLILYFIFDVSGSVELENFKKSVEFAKALVKKVGITEAGARAGALTFSSKTEEIFMPVTYSTTDEVLKALDEIPYTGGGTSTSSALETLRKNTIPLTVGVFKSKAVKSVIFILTDGKANTGGDPEEEARMLKDSHVEIYCIGITGSPEKEALYKIASDDKHVFILDSYTSLNFLVDAVTLGSVDYSKCGLGMEHVKTDTQRGKIVGGIKATEAWPWMVALYMVDEFSRNILDARLKCGGSIIDEYHVLTAAHCLYTPKHKLIEEDHIVLRAGLKNVNNQSMMQQFRVANFIFHENYIPNSNYNYDIALLRLKTPIDFNMYVRPICLPELEMKEDTTLYKANEYAYAIGFGHEGVIAKGEKVETITTDDLKEIEMPIQSREICRKSIQENTKEHVDVDRIFTKYMFCAGNGNGGADTCEGDSGGPLMQRRMNITDSSIYWTQVGIVSWGIGGSCGIPNTYGFYTHIQELSAWVTKKLKESKTE